MKFLLTLILMIPPQLALAQVQRVRLNFQECIEVALRNNDELRAMDQDIFLAQGKVIEAHPKGLPVIKYQHRLAPVPKDIDNAADSFFKGDISVLNNFKIEMGTPLTTFGKIKTAQELADIGVTASTHKQKDKADDIAIQIYKLYQGILLARDLLGLATQATDAINDKVKALEAEEFVDQIAILKLKVALYEVERRVEEARQKGALAVYAMKVQLGYESDVDFDITSNTLAPVSFQIKNIDYYLESARLYHPKYKLLNAGITALEKKVKLERLSPVPNLGAGGFFDIGRTPDIRGGEDESSFTNPFNFTKAGVGIELKGELDFIKTKAKVRQAEADLLKNIYLKRAALKGLELDIRKSHLEVDGARALLAKASQEKRAARQLMFLTKSNLDIGLGDKKDYLDALQSYLLFQGREFESIFNYNVAVYSLLNKIGQLYPDQEKGEVL